MAAVQFAMSDRSVENGNSRRTSDGWHFRYFVGQKTPGSLLSKDSHKN
jgi:hypothetical protein